MRDEMRDKMRVSGHWPVASRLEKTGKNWKMQSTASVKDWQRLEKDNDTVWKTL